MKIIILAGGSGTRLWPLSTEKFPKQFIKIRGKGESPFQDTFKRSLLLSNIDDIYVVTNEKYKFLVEHAIEELGYSCVEGNIIVEPVAKNTLPAIYAGVNEITNKGHDTVVVFPSDHMIKKSEEFAAIIKESEALTKDSIITFGILPDGPNTGYGYISPGEKKLNGFVVNSFKEKPTPEKAEEYIAEGFYWNAGIFMFNSKIFSHEVNKYSSEIFNAFQTSENINDAFSKINTKISIDYGIMEKSNKVAIVPIDIGWNDLGSFDSFYDVFQKNENGNISNEQNIMIDSKNNLIQSYHNKIVATVGIEDLIIVDSKDALLVCKKDQSQKVKEVVDILKHRNDFRSENSLNDYTHWGCYHVIEQEKDIFKLKKISVNKGKQTNLLQHDHRSLHLIVICGMAKVTIDGEEKIVTVGEHLLIYEGQKYYLENLGSESLEMIEILI